MDFFSICSGEFFASLFYFLSRGVPVWLGWYFSSLMPTLAVPAQSMVVTQVHFAEVGFVNGLPVGILYVLLSIVSAALAFEVCRQATENLLGGKQPMWARSISDRQGRFRLTVSLGVFILTMVLANSVYLQSTLFANIPEGPAVDQGLHLSLRMAFAVGGGIFATYVGGPPSRTNTVSCLLVGCAYAAARFYDFDPSTGSARMRMIFDIFVGTFCGRLSSFPEIFSYSSSLWSGLSKGKQREREVVELTTNIFVALLFGGVRRKEKKKKDIGTLLLLLARCA